MGEGRGEDGENHLQVLGGTRRKITVIMEKLDGDLWKETPICHSCFTTRCQGVSTCSFLLRVRFGLGFPFSSSKITSIHTVVIGGIREA